MRNIPRSTRAAVRQGNSYPSTVIDKIKDRVSVRLSTNGAIYRNLKLVGGPVSVGQLVYTDFTTPEPTVVAPGIDYSGRFEQIENMFDDQLPRPEGPIDPVYESDQIEVYQEGYWMRESTGEFVKLGKPQYFPVDATGLQGAIEACYIYGAIWIPDTPTGGIAGNFDFWYYQSVFGKGRTKTQITGQTTWRTGWYIQGLTLEHPVTAGPGAYNVGMVLYGDGFMRDITVNCYGISSGSGIGICNTEMSATWVADSCLINADIGLYGNIFGPGEGLEYIAQAEIGWTHSGMALPAFPAGHDSEDDDILHQHDYLVFCDHAMSKHDLHFYGKFYEMYDDYFHCDAACMVLKSTLYGNNADEAYHEGATYDHIDMWWLCSGSSAAQEKDANGWLNSGSNGSNFGEVNRYRSNHDLGYLERGNSSGHFIMDKSFWHFYLAGTIGDQSPTYIPEIPFETRTLWDGKIGVEDTNRNLYGGGTDEDDYGPGDMIHFSFDKEDNEIAGTAQVYGVGSSSGSGYPAGQHIRTSVNWNYKIQPEYTYFWMTRTGGLRGMTKFGNSSGSCYTGGGYHEDYLWNDHRASIRAFGITLKPQYFWMTRGNGERVWYRPTLFNARLTNTIIRGSFLGVNASTYSYVQMDDFTYEHAGAHTGTVVKMSELTQPVYSQDEPSDPFPGQMWFRQPE